MTADTVYGNENLDWVCGDDGSDMLYGGDGDDYLNDWWDPDDAPEPTP